MPFTFEPNTCIDCGYNPPCKWHAEMEEESDRLNYPRPNEEDREYFRENHPSNAASNIPQRLEPS